MGVLTTFLKLLKPSENDYYNQQTEQAGNWDKVDNYAVLTNTDKNAVWGGEYGGKIQDPIPKELNKRYIDNINGKAFICIKAGDSSVVSNTIEYFTPCNVVDNLDKLQNLDAYSKAWQLQAWFTGELYGGGALYFQNPKSIAIPKQYTEIMCRYSFSTSDSSVNTVTKKISSMNIGDTLMDELAIKLTGYDSDFYYFQMVILDYSRYSDNNGFIYAR